MTNNVCKCGDIKEAHFDQDLYIDLKVDSDLEKLLRTELHRIHTLYGDVQLHSYEQDNLKYLEEGDKEREQTRVKLNERGDNIMILTEEGCVDGIMHHNVQFDRCEDGHQVFKCPSCKKEFLEADDAGSGC